MNITARRAAVIRKGILDGRHDRLWATVLHQIGLMGGLWAKAYRHSHAIDWKRPDDFWDETVVEYLTSIGGRAFPNPTVELWNKEELS